MIIKACRRTLLVAAALPTLVQPLMASAQSLEADIGGYLAAGVDHYGAFYDRDGDPSTTRGVLRNAKLQVEPAWGKHWEAEIGRAAWRGRVWNVRQSASCTAKGAVAVKQYLQR